MAMSSGAGGDAGPRGRRRAVDAEPVRSRTAQNEIRVVLRLWWWFFGCCRLSACEVIFVRSGVKTLDDLDAGLWDLLLVLKWLPWLPRACRRNQGPSRGRFRRSSILATR